MKVLVVAWMEVHLKRAQNSVTYPSLVDGAHTFQVQAKDKAGNLSTLIEHKWTIDSQAPTIRFSQTPQKITNIKLAPFMFEISDNSGQEPLIQCKLDLETTWSVCKKIESINIANDGIHNIFAQAVDAAGNTSATITYSWTADYTGPAINFNELPLGNLSILDTVKIAFVVNDAHSAISSIKCGPDSNEVPCKANDSDVFTNMAVGNYKYTVKAVDALGNSTTKSVSWIISDNVTPVSQSLTVNQNNKADILIVIDNSASMQTEQKNMAERFATFIDKLNGLDWRVAIVTTDVSSNADKKDGRFLAFSGLSNQYFISSKMDLAKAKTAFANTIQRPLKEGSGQEQGIAAAYRAIERSQDPTTVSVSDPNRTFFRSDAVLSMLVVTDANETNPNGTETRNIPENLISYIKSLWPSKSFTYNSIVVKSGDTACKSTNGNEAYGISYEKLSGLTGGDIGSVCATDYTSQLSKNGSRSR